MGTLQCVHEVEEGLKGPGEQLHERPDAGPRKTQSLSRRQTLRLVQRHVDEGRPIAVVRFGEGEARLLSAEPTEPKSMKAAIKKLRRQTGLTFSPEQALKVKDLIIAALDKADVIGLHTGRGFSEEHVELGEQIETIYRQRVAEGRAPAYLTHSLVNNVLRDALAAILAAQRRVTVVSCRDIGGTLKAEHQLDEVTVHQIPSQYVVRDIDGSYEAAMHDVPIWPDLHHQLHKEIEIRRPGEIFLVGAGLFGKDLCVRIRDLGGIALDMGSTLDGIANKVTRGQGRPTFRPFPETPRLV